MSHQRHLEKKKYRQWVKAGLGLTYLREGLAPFCVAIANQQQKDILDTIKQTNNVPTVACSQCSWTTLRPDHAKGGNRACRLGQRNCNCCNPTGKIACPNKVCGAIYDAIVTSHGFTPPAPYWKNTETQHWCTDSWSIAKCFINAPGYDKKASAAEIDCIGLLHLIRNNQYFHNHIQCTIVQTDIFSKVLTDRNEIFHSSTMELEETDANAYIDDMIAVLQDGKELINRTEAQDAVKKLLELKKDDFIITTKSEADVLHAAVQSISDTIQDFEQKLREKLTNIPTTEAVKGLETRVTTLESDMAVVKEEIKDLKTEIKDLKSVRYNQRDQYDYVKSKLELQTRLKELYKEEQLHMSTFPLQQEGNLRDFKDVYVRPRMAIESKDKKDKKDNKNDKTMVDVVSMSDIFTNNGKPIKSIYVLGEAGSGKSSFCKSLVNYWCLAHSEDQSIRDDFKGVREMRKFEFLFLLPLRHLANKIKIKEMLEEKYEHSALKTLLESESRTCLVVLDGLDEWAPTQSHIKSPPKPDSLKDYTVITTSRPWKIGTLGITDNEIRQKIILKGFDESSVKDMIKNTVPILNAEFEKNKDPNDCEKALENNSVESLVQTAITLQQLICLWYDNKLHETSKCALYTGMLDMFFEWNEKKYPVDPRFAEMKGKSEDLKNVELPQYLIGTEVCKRYSYIIHGVSRLAYETLFNNTKETSLSFDSSTFERLDISNKVKACCLQIGILSEEKCISLSASRSQRSVISFVHKSFQEYLAAVYIAIKFKAHIVPSADLENANSSDHFIRRIQKLFCPCATTADAYDADPSNNCVQFVKSRCTTLDEILEQANVFTLLCGLEPRLATSISKYINDIVTRDKRVLDYRRTIDDEYRHMDLIVNIQRCILNCIEEVQSSHTDIRFSFYLGDIVLIGEESDFEQFCTILDNQYIPPDTVMSFRIHIDEENLGYVKRVLKYLQKCRRLEAFRIGCYSSSSDKIDDEVIKSMCDTIDGNTSTLKALYVSCYFNNTFKPVVKTKVRRLSAMSHLVALQIQYLTMTHRDFTSLCSLLSGTSQLEQISLCDINCWCGNKHEVDLSKHQQLQYLQYNKHVCVTRVNTSNLEIYECRSLNSMNCVKVLDSLSTANKLTKLVLWYDIYNDLTHGASSDRTPAYQTVTDKLITLLPLLHQLRELVLHGFTFTDNIIKFPSDMKSMKSISLWNVTMSVTTWRKFVDSVPGMPLPVQVEAWHMYITRDGEEYNRDRGWEKGEGRADAYQYVREQEEMFNVERDYEHSIYFSTKK